MAGQRQPTNLVIMNGKKHLTKAETKERLASEVKVESDKVTAPDYLSKKQKEEFENLSKELINAKIMTNLDCDTLARFIIAKDFYKLFSKKMNSKEVQEDIFLFEKVSKLQNTYFNQCQSASKDLGLTISSRCKISVPNAPTKSASEIIKDALSG